MQIISPTGKATTPQSPTTKVTSSKFLKEKQLETMDEELNTRR